MMKKVLVIIMSYLVSGLLCFNLSAEDDLADKIHIHRTNPTTRSLIDLPEAIICRELLTVSHNASGVYSLQIENSLEHIILRRELLQCRFMKHLLILEGKTQAQVVEAMVIKK